MPSTPMPPHDTHCPGSRTVPLADHIAGQRRCAHCGNYYITTKAGVLRKHGIWAGSTSSPRRPPETADA